jgi:hypothetical protein
MDLRYSTQNGNTDFLQTDIVIDAVGTRHDSPRQWTQRVAPTSKAPNGAAWTGKFYGSEGLAFPGELS